MKRRQFNFPQKLAPNGVVDVDVINAHTHSSNHRPELFGGERCGCLAVFPADAIEDWTDEINGVGATAICPECGIDTVLGSASGYPI